MVSTLPAPIKFELPDGWIAADPDQVGASGAAFVALNSLSQSEFTANITIDGVYNTEESSLEEIAEKSLNELRGLSSDTILENRTAIESNGCPGLIQIITLSNAVDGSALSLAQAQVYLVIRKSSEHEPVAVVRLSLTADRDQYDHLVDDFQDFLRTVRPD